MAESAKKIIPVKLDKNNVSTDSVNDIKGRRSQELIIGLCGAIGSGIKTLKDQTILSLKQSGYHVEHIRISDLISEYAKVSTKKLGNFDRYNKLQDLGDSLREQHKNFICAELAVFRIQVLREEFYGVDTQELTKNTKKQLILLIK